MIENNKFMPEELLGNREAKVESEDSYRYEIDTNTFLDRIYYYWIGYTKFDGEWVKDPNRKPVMTQELADKLINEITYRVNTHSFLSTYDERFITKISVEAALVINRTLMFETEQYKLSTNDFNRLIVALKHIFMSLLRIAQHGHMVQYRMNKGKINIIRQERDDHGGVV